MAMKALEWLKRSIAAAGLFFCSQSADIPLPYGSSHDYQSRSFYEQVFFTQKAQPPGEIINAEALAYVGLPYALEERKRIAVVDVHRDLFAEISHGDYTSYITEAALENEEVIRVDIGKYLIQNHCYEKLFAGRFVQCANGSVAEAVDEAVDAGPDVISLSIGVSWGSMLPVLREKGCEVNDIEYNIGKIGSGIRRGMEEGIVFVASAGNERSESYLAYPACIDGVLSSGALKKKDDEWKIASFSNRARETYFSPQAYHDIEGTSFSGPVLASLIAVALADKNCSYIPLDEILQSAGKGIMDHGSYYRIPTVGEIKGICELKAKSRSY
ncbi:MAG: S8 family serine peptidase [Candidatus Aenigmarchaeota archaeon]|nr:S8 family serine peptidase [Candidatus Aenigmarchaeota archaeon]